MRIYAYYRARAISPSLVSPRARNTIMHRLTSLFVLVAATVHTAQVQGDIGLISPEQAKALIENLDPKKRPVVLDTRGGYKDYFRGHIPTAHHINFDTL